METVIAADKRTIRYYLVLRPFHFDMDTKFIPSLQTDLGDALARANKEQYSKLIQVILTDSDRPEIKQAKIFLAKS